MCQVKEDEVAGNCSMNGGEDEHIGLLIGKPEGKRLLGRHKWVDNIRKDLIG
jgi:hypothetical protein